MTAGGYNGHGVATSASFSLRSPLGGQAEAGGPYAGRQGVAVGFDGGASDDADGTIAQYDWDYGDGTIDIDSQVGIGTTFTLRFPAVDGTG